MATSSLRAPAARDSAGVDAALLILRVVLGLLDPAAWREQAAAAAASS